MKIFIALLLVTIGTLATAQFRVDRTAICDSTPTVIEQLTSERYSESVSWVGSSKDQSRYALFTNSETGSWTFIHFNEEIACILGVGSKYMMAPLGNSI